MNWPMSFYYLWQNVVYLCISLNLKIMFNLISFFFFLEFCLFYSFLLYPGSIVIKHQDLINIFLIYVLLPFHHGQFNGNSWKAWNYTKETIFDVMFCSIKQYWLWNKGPLWAIFQNRFQYFEIIFQSPIASFIYFLLENSKF